MSVLGIAQEIVSRDVGVSEDASQNLGTNRLAIVEREQQRAAVLMHQESMTASRSQDDEAVMQQHSQELRCLERWEIGQGSDRDAHADGDRARLDRWLLASLERFLQEEPQRRSDPAHGFRRRAAINVATRDARNARDAAPVFFAIQHDGVGGLHGNLGECSWAQCAAVALEIQMTDAPAPDCYVVYATRRLAVGGQGDAVSESGAILNHATMIGS
ncbi:MAG: hypothetical protein U1E76_06320 [Planctomycetota bacterium]